MADYGCSCCATAFCQNAEPGLWNSDLTAAPRAVPADGPDFILAEPDFARGPDFADSVPGNSSSAAPIVPGSSVDVVIETATDHDWYRVTLTAGTTYVFHTTSVSGSSADPFLTLRDAAGTRITDDDDSGDGTNSLISYTPTVTGTYFIDAGTFAGGGQSSAGTYHLSLTAVPAFAGDAVVETTATTATLAVGGGIAGNIDTVGDRDWYAIALTAGETYIFRTGSAVPLSGDGAPPGSVDTRLTLRDGAGAQLQTNDDAGEYGYSAIRFTPTATGTYYLDVGTYSGSNPPPTGASTGSFILTAFTTPPLVLFTNDQIATQLSSGYWGGSTHHFNVAPGGTLTYNLGTISAAAMNLAREAFNLWSDVTGIVFAEVTSGGQISFTDNQTGAFANASYSGGITTSGTVNVQSTWNRGNFALNSYSFQTFIHEIGHVLGLGHAGNYNGNANYATDALYLNDAWATTVMSYFSQTENSYFQGLGFTQEFILSPMVADEIATTSLYGNATTTRTGNTTYGFNNTSGRAIYDASQNPDISYTIFDDGGIDTLDYSGFTQTQRIDLNTEAFSNVGGRTGNVTIARGVIIENAVGGSGNDTIIGNAANNSFDLRQGGVDTVNGGAGDDSFNFGAKLTAADSVNGGGGANDQVGITGNYTGANRLVLGATTLVDVDVLAVLPGGSYDIVINNATVAAGTTFTVFGGNLGVGESLAVDGSAELDGNIIVYSGLGTDTLNGGAGADGFYFGPGKYGATDTVHGGTGANDQLALDGDYTLTLTSREDVEVFVMLRGPVGTPNTFNITVADSFTPAGQQRILFGLSTTTNLVVNGAAETDGTLRFFGGSGSDTLTGGAGNDYFFGNTGADTLTGGGGADMFAYNGANESTGSGWDRLVGLTNGVDKIDLPGTISGVAATVAGGALSTGSFNADLAAAIGAGQMGAGQAVLYTPTSGTLAGNVFLVADANGIAGYQADQDFVFQLPTPPPVITVDLFV
ncbi:M10 family metallopeptidase C-terminal domain-containing protein [Sphingomonas sp. SUN039]|uniref:M10 family metallopeptidase C-terminal domain-containing protein n=1 Tax=Sphingomonas sp. SUN039 TaxID=2937787 RepID=UPI0021644664|nr:M10 family metallopeptidase C-terminal domain-containing protein [Sphingomonas sp. SUN039]UVO54905.1 M10 family metallopeptidase C-terminal domain-containing protein [Sphingomonas sp. SUN039]